MKNKIIASLVYIIIFFTGGVLHAFVTIDWVSVSDPGNQPDNYHATDGTTNYGAVNYNYKIGKFEVTCEQYAVFLNNKAKSDPYGLWNPGMGASGQITRTGDNGSYIYSASNSALNRPISYIGWFDAARFANWINNGQQHGSTETGAYNLNGATSIYDNINSRFDSGIFVRQPDASIWIPTENEWYKAAYYDATINGYWLYPTRNDTAPLNSMPYTQPNKANYSDWRLPENPQSFTDVGSFSQSASYYGTFDQGGNVAEWTDGVISTSRVLRGGWTGEGVDLLRADVRDIGYLFEEGTSMTGFRLATIPEPSTSAFSILSLLCISVYRRRRN